MRKAGKWQKVSGIWQNVIHNRWPENKQTNKKQKVFWKGLTALQITQASRNVAKTKRMAPVGKTAIVHKES